MGNFRSENLVWLDSNHAFSIEIIFQKKKKNRNFDDFLGFHNLRGADLKDFVVYKKSGWFSQLSLKSSKIFKNTALCFSAHQINSFTSIFRIIKKQHPSLHHPKQQNFLH